LFLVIDKLFTSQSMSRYPSVIGSDMIKSLAKIGFLVVRIKGSHHRLEHPDGRKTPIPVHGKETLGPGILLKILRDLDLTRDNLLKLL
jgi:predicted RNA binding protein YcfA (HicA-like mRNA interferase family)